VWKKPEAVLNRGIAVCAEDDEQRMYLLEAKAVVLLFTGQPEAVDALATCASASGRMSQVWDAAGRSGVFSGRPWPIEGSSAHRSARTEAAGP